MRAILFDWDGTIADTLGALYEANVAVMEAFGLPFDELLYRRHFAPDWRLMYGRLGVPRDRLEEANELWHAAYDQGRAARPFAGAREAVVALLDAGLRVGLVTAGHGDVVRPQLERFGFAGLFEVAVFGDDVAFHKPDPEPLRRALGALGLESRPDEATYLGDVPDDMRMARAVGTGAVGITSTLGVAEDLLAAGADEVAESVAGWVAAFLAARPTATGGSS